MDIEDRKCQVCNTNAIEDEIHFLFSCKKLKEARDVYTSVMVPHDVELEKTDKVALLRTCLSEQHLKQFADWLVDMYHARKHILYK